jgi:hypothetical protein
VTKTPEQRVLIIMAPIRRQGRAPLIEELRADTDNTRAVLHAIVDEQERALVHHARFVVVDHFYRWNDTSEPCKVRLPHSAGYLLFACWMDGDTKTFGRRLLQKLGRRRFPLRHCHGFPGANSLLPPWMQTWAVERFFARAQLPTAFAYQSYADSTDAIVKALELRTSYLDLLRVVEEKPQTVQKELAAFFAHHAGELDDD